MHRFKTLVFITLGGHFILRSIHALMDSHINH